jgi:hypothetical protein
MKRFLAFSFSMYDASGGFSDCIGDFDTLTEAKDALSKSNYPMGSELNNGHVLDTTTLKLVFEYTDGEINDEV